MTRRYPRETLARTAAVSTSLVDLMRRVGAPLGSISRGYLHGRLKHYGIDTTHFVDEPLPPRERRDYSPDRLREAAAHAYSVREVLEYLGLPPDDASYGHVRKKLDQFGIDTSHFVSGRRQGPPTVPRRELAAAVPSSTSIAGLLRVLGIADNAAARQRVRRSLTLHGLSITHFTGQRHFLGTVSPHRKTADAILRRLPPGSDRTRTPMLRRALDDLGVAHTCAACGIGDVWRGERLVLEIDHISGDRLDNRRENLRYLCPSCHSQTASFARGGER